MENGKNGCVMFEDWEISDAVFHYKMEKTCFPLSLLLFFTLETAASTEFFLIFSPLMKTSASYSQCDECKHMTLTESALAWQHEAAPEWKFNKYNHGKWLLFIDHIYYNAIDCTHRHWLWWVFVFFFSYNIQRWSGVHGEALSSADGQSLFLPLSQRHNSFLQRQEGKIHRFTLTVVSENQCFQEIRDCSPPRVFIIALNIQCSQELFCKWPHFHISYGIIIF